MSMLYRFINAEDERFEAPRPYVFTTSYLPLTDKNGGLFSAITPFLSGDIKNDNDTFLTHPASVEDLKLNYLDRRDFILLADGRVFRLSEPSDEDSLQSGFFYQEIKKRYKKAFTVDVLNFIPQDLPAEIMQITVTNTRPKPLSLQGFSLMYVYARSAENLRDHRHVTSLLQRTAAHTYGLTYKPTMVFNEKGHRLNTTQYFVLGTLKHGKKTVAPCCKIADLDYVTAQAAGFHDTKNIAKQVLGTKGNRIKQGVENAAVLVFPSVTLRPNSSITITLAYGIGSSDKRSVIRSAAKIVGSCGEVPEMVRKTRRYWRGVSGRVHFQLGTRMQNQWIQWVGLQPLLRKLFGCSFLPHFDYGKGGRGWRDLWQDALTLLLIEPEATKDMIVNNFKGIRIDGSNATIITRDGSFKSDRNNISRVWMDHGVWPYMTLKLYFHQTGDWEVFLKKTGYYRDHQLKRSQEVDYTFRGNNVLSDHAGNPHEGTILEHILVQILVQFYNVGQHNIIRLENADWNDGLDMAGQNGESVAFSCMYASHLKDIADLLASLPVESFELTEELLLLLDTLEHPVDYASVQEKLGRLQRYFEATKTAVSGKKITLEKGRLLHDLRKKADWMYAHIRAQEWNNELSLFNGYYDNAGMPVDGKKGKRTHVTLTGQVFPIMSGITGSDKIAAQFTAIRKYLFDKKVQGFRLNTDFKELQLDLGRGFSFIYGDKENGAFFSHMNVMLAFALYSRGYAQYGSFVLQSIMNMSLSERAGMYPNLPEYFDSKGTGKYAYLTGSASWFIYTMLQQVFGVRGQNGDLLLEPKLTAEEFKEQDTLSVSCSFAGKRITVVYTNEKKISFPRYSPELISVNGLPVPADSYIRDAHHIVIKRETLLGLCTKPENELQIRLL